MRKLLLAFLLSTLTLAAYATTPVGTSQQVNISGQMAFGTQQVYPNVLFQYQEPGTTTAQFSGSTTIAIAGSTSNVAVNTATLFPGVNTPICYVLQEITNPPQQLNVGLASGGARLDLNPQGFLMVRVVGGTPTFYVDNPESTPGLLQVSVLSN